MQIRTVPVQDLVDNKPLLRDGHEFDFIMLDVSNAMGLALACFFDAPQVITAKPIGATLTPGAILPVANNDPNTGKRLSGRAVYARPLIASMQSTDPLSPYITTGVYAQPTQPLTLWCLTRDELGAVGGRERRPGERLWHANPLDSGTLAATTSETILSGLIVAPISYGIPCRISGWIKGGNETTRTATVRYPTELIFRQCSPLGNFVDRRVLLFPGDAGSCRFSFDIESTISSNASAVDGWSLTAYNPNAVGVNVSWSVELIAGHLGDRHDYQLAYYTAAATRDTNTQTTFALVTQPQRDDQVAAVNSQLSNGASGAATLNHFLYQYWPSVFGGPYSFATGTGSTAASTVATISSRGANRFWYDRFVYSADPGASCFYAAAMVG